MKEKAKEDSRLVKVAISGPEDHSRALDGVYNAIAEMNGNKGPQIIPIRNEGGLRDDYGAYVSVIDANNISVHDQEWLKRRIKNSSESPYLLLIERKEGMEFSEGAKQLSEFLGSRADVMVPENRIHMHKISPEDSYKSSKSRFRQFYEEQIK